MMQRSHKQFLLFFIPMVLAAAGLILLIPQLIDSGTPTLWGLSSGLAVVAAACAVMAYRLRPAAHGRESA